WQPASPASEAGSLPRSRAMEPAARLRSGVEGESLQPPDSDPKQHPTSQQTTPNFTTPNSQLHNAQRPKLHSKPPPTSHRPTPNFTPPHPQNSQAPETIKPNSPNKPTRRVESRSAI